VRFCRTIRLWLVVGVIAASVHASTPVQARSNVVQGLQVTDLADTVFAVTFTTSAERTATIRYGISPAHLSMIARDDRDAVAGTRSPVRSTVHRITLLNLTYSTTYYFEPVVDGVSQPSQAGRPFKQTTAPLQAPRVPVRIHGTVVTAARSTPASASVLLIGQWINPDGNKSGPVSVLSGTPNSNHTAATYDLVPTLLTADGAAPFMPRIDATFRVTALADDRGHLVMGGPVSARQGLHITLLPLLKLSAPSRR
jgi:hypothetical protein